MVKNVELMGLVFVMISLLKYVSTVKMLIMMMSLEMCSIFLFFLLVVFSWGGGFLGVGLYCVFLVLVISEGVIVLIGMLNIYRKGSLMVKSLGALKF